REVRGRAAPTQTLSLTRWGATPAARCERWRGGHLRRGPTRYGEGDGPGDVRGEAPPTHARGAEARRGPATDGGPGGMGPIPDRAAMGHGARGLQSTRDSVGLLPVRARALPRISLGRGRPGRHL